MEVGIMIATEPKWKYVLGLAGNGGITYNLGYFKNWDFTKSKTFDLFRRCIASTTEHEFLHFIGFEVLGRPFEEREVNYIRYG